MNKVILMLLSVLFIAGLYADDKDPAELAQLNTSYQTQVKSALDPINKKYIAQLDALKKQLGAKGDIEGAVNVQKEIDSMKSDSDIKQDINKIVIWNQHNAGYNDRGTKAIRIKFYSNNQVAYKLENQELTWERGSDCKNEFPLPTVRFEKVRIEILATFLSGGGLSEVEIIKDGVNIAKNARVSVSGVYGNLKEFQGETLIDGVTTSKEQRGYWLLPDNTLGWCELKLNPSAK